jgi:hypothetical protein
LGPSAQDALDFVGHEGIVLQAARGPVPSLAEFVAGERIQGSWWGHPKGQAIFRAAEHVIDSGEVPVCRLVDGKITYVHRRLWPALVRLAAHLPHDGLALVLHQLCGQPRFRGREAVEGGHHFFAGTGALIGIGEEQGGRSAARSERGP